METDTKALWQGILNEIELSTSKTNFATWFKNTHIKDVEDDGTIVIGVPNGFVKEWLENKYHKTILRCLRTTSPSIKSVCYEIISRTEKPERQKKTGGDEHADVQLDFKEFRVDPETNLNPRYTFDTFVVGSFNELAHAAAQAVLNNLGHIYNPLFIYGGVGLGKTHLLQAVGNEVRKQNASLSIQYISAEKFTTDLVSAIQLKNTTSFKEYYRKFDLLIIDDVQFISGKQTTQEELFYTFNALYEANKQIIFSSDKPPKAIHDIEDRLRSRFEGGMIADISEPEYEARIAILKTKTALHKISLEEEILHAIASSVQRNIRELEGVLNMVIARVKMTGKMPASDDIRVFINKNIKPKKTLSANKVIQTVAEFYDINEKLLFEKTRRKEIVKPRQIAMFLLREDLSGSYPSIGERFGGRDHTTAIHAYEKILKEIENNERLSREISEIRKLLYSE